MAKSAADIIAAHKNTIEVFTGKKCEITLIDKVQQTLALLSLNEILTAVEHFNGNANSIEGNSMNRSVVALRKIFCVLANRAGYSAIRIGKFLTKDRTTILFHISTGKNYLDRDEDFKKLYALIEAHIQKQYVEKILQEK